MKHLSFACMALLMISVVPSVRGDMRVRLFDGYGQGNGGEFDVRFTQDAPSFSFSSTIGTKSWNTQATRFSTFCLERDEFIGFNTEYRATIDAMATGGGNNTNTGDALNPWTAYLYTQFATGQLTSYDYLPAFGAGNLLREADGGALQQAIWFLENELSVNGSFIYDPHVAANAQTALGLNSQAYRFWDMARIAGWDTIRNVRVLNLTGLDGTERQSQLIMIPIPAAVLLGLIGSGILIAFRHRFA